MISQKIKYRTGYKYQLAEKVIVLTGLRPLRVIENQFCELDTDGILEIKPGYAWDGPSGPTFDTKTAMRASLVHDALYQFMREELLSLAWRPLADEELRRIGVEDGMWQWRAALWKRMVRRYAESSATIKRDIFEAP